MAGPYVTIRVTLSGEVEATGAATTTGDAAEKASPQTVPIAKAGSLTTRTNDTSGTITMSSGSHGITTGQRVDLYWVGGACYGATVGTVSGTAVPIASVLGGAVLPAQDTAITVGIATEVPFDCVGDDILVLALSGWGSDRAYFAFADGGGDIPAAASLQTETIPLVSGLNSTNILAGETPTKVFMSHDSLTAAKTDMKAVAIR